MGIANELIVRGWTQGRLEDAEGRVCLRGAVFKAIPNRKDARSSIKFIDSQLLNGENSAVWNNFPGRTLDEVLLVGKQADELLGL